MIKHAGVSFKLDRAVLDTVQISVATRLWIMEPHKEPP